MCTIHASKSIHGILHEAIARLEKADSIHQLSMISACSVVEEAVAATLLDDDGAPPYAMTRWRPLCRFTGIARPSTHSALSWPLFAPGSSRNPEKLLVVMVLMMDYYGVERVSRLSGKKLHKFCDGASGNEVQVRFRVFVFDRRG